MVNGAAGVTELSRSAGHLPCSRSYFWLITVPLPVISPIRFLVYANDAYWQVRTPLFCH